MKDEANGLIDENLQVLEDPTGRKRDGLMVHWVLPDDFPPNACD